MSNEMEGTLPNDDVRDANFIRLAAINVLKIVIFAVNSEARLNALVTVYKRLVC